MAALARDDQDCKWSPSTSHESSLLSSSACPSTYDSWPDVLAELAQFARHDGHSELMFSMDKRGVEPVQSTGLHKKRLDLTYCNQAPLGQLHTKLSLKGKQYVIRGIW